MIYVQFVHAPITLTSEISFGFVYETKLLCFLSIWVPVTHLFTHVQLLCYFYKCSLKLDENRLKIWNNEENFWCICTSVERRNKTSLAIHMKQAQVYDSKWKERNLISENKSCCFKKNDLYHSQACGRVYMCLLTHTHTHTHANACMHHAYALLHKTTCTNV